MSSTPKKSTIWTRGFICIMISNVFASLATFSVNTYLTTYMTWLDVGADLAGLIAGIYYAVGLLMRPISGPMQATMNKKKLMTATFVLAFIVNLSYARFPRVVPFVIFRLIHGVYLAFYGSLTMTIAASSLPEEKMSSGLGVYGLTGIVSQTLGPSAGVAAMDLGNSLWGDGGGFRAIFLMSALFSLFSVLPCFFLPEIDAAETVEEKKEAWYKQIIAKEALIPSAVYGLFIMGSMVLTTYMIPYGEYKGISNVGLYFTISAVFMVLTRPIAGRITDHFGPNHTFYPGMALYMMAFVLIANARSLIGIVAGAACAAMGAGIVNPGLQSMTMQSVPRRKRAVASNTLYTIMDIGNFLGPTLGGFILSRSGNRYETMWLSVLVPLGLAMVVFALGWKTYQHNHDLAQAENGAADQ